jgi:membrane protein implicated in regulation of membrane protease activity
LRVFLPEGVLPVRNAVNWTLVALGGLLIVAEVVMGATTGFDLALMGVALAAGGGIGLFIGSTKAGLFASGALAFLYLAVLRRRLRSRLSGRGRPSNVDALVGRSGIVLARVAPNAPGQVKLGDEVWRAVLSPAASGALEPGASVTVESVEGVTLTVR